MAFSVTGSKYGGTTIASVGTTTVTAVAASYVSGDFVQTRLMGLWNAAGTVLKGAAWVRRFISTSQLELQTPFFDFATGVIATQVVGDQIQVSKNHAESVVAGLAVSGKTVTITDQISYGSAAADSVCFYDEDKEISSTSQVKHVGGLVVWGKLDSYAARQTSSACDFYTTIGGNSTALHTDGANANFWMFGGIIGGVNSPLYFGGYQGTAGNSLGFWNVQNPFDFISPGAGGAWGANASRMQLINCYGITTAFNAIMQRWGNGVISGGQYKFPNFTSGPISIFGNDGGGTFSVAAPPNTRAVVLDMGNGPCLVRGGPTVFTFTNLITTDRRNMSGASGSLVPNNSASATFRFSDSYTALQAGTVGVILDSASAVADSILSSAAEWSPSLLRATSVGVTVTINSTSWTFSFKKYGFEAVSGTIAVGTYDLGTAGTPENVSFTRQVVQLVDTGTTVSEAAALALSSKFSASSVSTGTLTVTANATLDEVYDYLVAWGCSSVALAQFPSLSAYPITFAGSQLTTAMLIVVNVGATLSAGAKYKSLVSAGVTLNGGISGLTLVSAVTQATPTNLSNVTITGNLSYNTASTLSVTYTGVNVTLVKNDGVGIVSITPSGTVVISDYSDPQINYLDSTLTVINATSAIIYSSAVNRDGNISPGATISPTLAFKHGSTVSGVPMTGTVYFRVTSGSSIFLSSLTLAVGANILDMGIPGQLALIPGNSANAVWSTASAGFTTPGTFGNDANMVKAMVSANPHLL
jgi:hypothetical protein